MGLTLQGAGALAGGTVQGFQGQRADNRAQSAESRTAEQYGLEKTFRDIFAKRNDVDQPDPPPQQGAVPTGPPGAVQGALPVDPNAQGPNTLGTMEVTGAPATRSRRDKYNEWKKIAEDAAVRAGGLEGLSSFNKMETEISRQQVMGYGLEAIRALNGGSVGEAAKIANTALEASPNDTGLEFFAMNGELYMQGAEGDPSGPLNADALRVFVEDHMKSPETYLAWQKQYEDERANKAKEGIGQQNADSTTLQAETYAEESPSRILLNKAKSYQALAAGEAALTSASDSGGDEGLAWNENNILKIEEMEATAMDGGLGFSGSWVGEGARNSQLHSDAVSAAVETRIANGPAAMTHNDASTLARMAYFDGLVDNDGNMVPPQTGLLDGLRNVKVLTDDQGNYMVNYKGKNLMVPPHVGTKIQSNKQYLVE